MRIVNKRFVAGSLVVLAPFLVGQPLAGQTKPADKDNARWHVSLYGGTTSAGPAMDLEQAFVQEDYNQSSSCGFPGCTPKTFPYSVTGWGQTGLPFTVMVRYRVVGPAELGVIAGRTPIGETAGYHYPIELDMEYGVTLFAATAGVTVRLPLPTMPRLGFAAGPAWYDAFWTPIEDQKTLFTGHQHATGLLGRAGFEVPVDRNVLVGFDFQYRSVGTITVGPVALPTATNRHDLPAMPADFDHWCASLGFSIGL